VLQEREEFFLGKRPELRRHEQKRASETCRCLLREEFGTEELVNAATDDEDDREFEPGGEEEGLLVGESLG
jgi:hypothetical protein